MDSIYFLVRYIPFWAIPVILIAGEFAYIYWLKSRKMVVVFFLGMAFFSFCSIIFYYWNGGPEKSVQTVIKLIRH